MRRILGLILFFGWISSGGSQPPAPDGAESTAPATKPGTAATNLPPPAQTVPDNLLPAIIARFPFDFHAGADPAAGAAIPSRFFRDSAAYSGDLVFAAGKPRLIAGKFGRGILLEERHANLLSPRQADAEGEEPDEFIALNQAKLKCATNAAWQGGQALRVDTPGSNGAEGLAVEAVVEQARYDGRRIVPAHYVASVYLKGSGALMLTLQEPGATTDVEPVTLNLSAAQWTRCACVQAADFPAQAIGPGHEADWPSLLPARFRRKVKLQLACATVDKSKATFFADGLQLEPRLAPAAGQGINLAPRSWIPGKTAAAQDEFSVATSGAAFTNWPGGGAISFWFNPAWDAQDGGRELILYLGPSAIFFQHANGRLRFQPAGVEFLPYDWRGAWHHIAVTWDAAGRRVLYLDGYDYANPRGEVQPLAEALERLALSSPGAGNAPNGIVDELILFNRALSLEEIKAISAYQPVTRKPGMN